MRPPHTITQTELADTYKWLLASSSREDKQLYGVLTVTEDSHSTTFEVWHEDTLVLTGGLASCIRAYNSITSRRQVVR